MELFVSALQMLATIAFTKEKYGCRKQAQQHTHTHNGVPDDRPKWRMVSWRSEASKLHA